MTRALVTGGSGFIGQHLVSELMARGIKVRVLDVLLPTRALPDVDYVQGSVLDQRLVPQTHAENRRRLAQAPNHIHRHPCLFRAAGSRRDDNAIGLHVRDVLDRHDIVAHDAHVGTELAKILDEVIGERIVVIDD